jgi:hypothetical protein
MSDEQTTLNAADVEQLHKAIKELQALTGHPPIALPKIVRAVRNGLLADAGIWLLLSPMFMIDRSTTVGVATVFGGAAALIGFVVTMSSEVK